MESTNRIKILLHQGTGSSSGSTVNTNHVLEDETERAADRNHDGERTDRYKLAESMTELTETGNYTDRQMLHKQTGRAQIKAIHGR